MVEFKVLLLSFNRTSELQSIEIAPTAPSFQLFLSMANAVGLTGITVSGDNVRSQSPTADFQQSLRIAKNLSCKAFKLHRTRLRSNCSFNP